MQSPLILAVSDHPVVFERIRAGFEPDFDVLAMAPHAESVIAAAAALGPVAVVADLSRRSVRTAAVTARLLDEIPEVRLVALMEPEPNPDVKRRFSSERGLETDALGAELTQGLKRAFGRRLTAVHLDPAAEEAASAVWPAEIGYSPTFNC